MIITYHGLEFFKIQFGEIVIAFNPPSKESELKSSRFSSDVVLISLNHKDFNGADTLTGAEKKPFVVNGPGEYETKDIFIKGFSSKSSYGGEEQINTIYMLSLESMNLCFLGGINSPDLPQQFKDNLTEDIDVLFVPIGNEGVLDSAMAYKLAVKLEPKIIIPMHYSGEDDKYLKMFLKEEGISKLESLDKLTLKPKDLVGKEGEIITLSQK